MATISFHPATKEQCDAILGQLKNIPVTTRPVYYHRKIVADDKLSVSLVWIDPEDVVLEGVHFADWEKTVIVRKRGETPASIDDGEIVAVETVRNLYSTEATAFVDDDFKAADADGWEYRAFPFSTNGGVNMSESNVFKTYEMFGFCIDEGDPGESSCVSYIEGATGFTPASMNFNTGAFDYGSWGDVFFIRGLKPCMLKTDGTVDYYLDPDDLTKKLDGTDSDVANLDYDGNAMVEWSVPVFYRAVKSGTKMYVYVSDQKIDDSFECFSALKADGTYGKFYLPIYEGTFTNAGTTSTAYSASITKMRSMSTGTPANRIIELGDNLHANAIYNSTSATEKSMAEKNSADWGVTRWADEELVRVLSVLMFKRLNFQAALTGTWPTGSALSLECGAANDKGLFWGKGDNSTTAFKMFGMENWFGHRNRRCTGIVLLDGEYYIKMTKHAGDGSRGVDFVASDSATDYKNAYIATGTHFGASNGQYINACHGVTTFDKDKKWSCVFMPSGCGGSSSIHYCDAGYNSAGVRGVVLGGNVGGGAIAGLFCVNAAGAPSNAIWSFGASLSYRNF